MAEEKNKNKMPHNLFMNDCEKLTLTGVNDVKEFDDKSIICFTDKGELVIKGTQLKVDKMDTVSGDMEVCGRISALIYTGEAKRTNSVFSKLFK